VKIKIRFSTPMKSHQTSTKKELIKEIQRIEKEGVAYWLKSDVEKSGNEYILVNIQGEGLCAGGLLKVNNWTNIEGIRKKTKGKSYIGAELRNLTFDIKYSESNIEFIYKNVAKIID
jgi:hypothetical protein